MRMKVYEDPNEAYGVLKKLYGLSPKDESLFAEKKIEYVMILFDRRVPVGAWAEYKIGNDVCIRGLELKGKTEDISDKL
jgi:hypothetical protein